MMNIKEALKEAQKRCQSHEFCSAGEAYYALGQCVLDANKPFCINFDGKLYRGASFDDCLTLLDADINADEILFRKFEL